MFGSIFLWVVLMTTVTSVNYFLDCGELVDFFVFLKALIRESWSEEYDLDVVFVWGMWERGAF